MVKIIFLGIMFVIQLKEITLDITVVVSSLLSICKIGLLHLMELHTVFYKENNIMTFCSRYCTQHPCPQEHIISFQKRPFFRREVKQL